MLGGVLRRAGGGGGVGLPLFTKPLKTRLRLIDEAFALMQPDAPFVQFTYDADLADPEARSTACAPRPPSGSG